ncbi:MAG: hypothetical protein COY38_03930 [Candidatus Aenigmarchaeota archaeon CG_4_10_14_0_8_um_filter_37_24]|nr:hypothetical protein [Candidatus Aenigmarchaeota archaeon]OIN86577.1 MAG: hypothetical protein AUJ50_03770 [Candidatus Aenigmarchaeota archaeon CG1_02_38_14]PIV69398.1 MAG: hypothetical protein COS07_00910 [Candidatus Aenigmarchaeota archaeon CG01_land_8_20_14_3_00_37_9]PIW41712.1 MAG: hypothetical protein COW21_00455 [Candidatus Aenigmarchaeota archaeon CG15_BIG_FIL_POST_REV_8_21_14_020_37_27]PIX50541.1 MAG: hypothetical protein COZ52_03445 [Candidatus Aenigmarchaeota archaeon CG_4_8_14_3_u
MDREIFIYDMMFKLSGIIFQKAQMENNFEKVYNQVFTKTITTDFESDMDMLEIFGNVGG